jgi:hypothetical protein
LPTRCYSVIINIIIIITININQPPAVAEYNDNDDDTVIDMDLARIKDLNYVETLRTILPLLPLPAMVPVGGEDITNRTTDESIHLHSNNDSGGVSKSPQSPGM